MPLLYVHVPFCIRKCAYCAFYSQPTTPDQVDVYLEGLALEARICKEDASQGVSSLFIGGGTPTALEPDQLGRLFEILHRAFALDAEIEQTVEANPGTLTPEKLQLLRRWGVNRLSLGVQSFEEELLRRIGRIHTVEEIQVSIEWIRGAGFTNLNLDLMFGLPGQTLELWRKTLERAVSFRPEHLSLYALMLEEGTPLAGQSRFGVENSAWRLPDDDEQAAMYEFAVNFLERCGYIHYETSNFALPGCECQHNLGYWLGRDYLGLGPGAVSCLGGVRRRNVEDVDQYKALLEQGQYPVSDCERLTAKERMSERVMLGLRLMRGFDLSQFEQEFGVRFADVYGHVVEPYLQQGILKLEEGRLKLNPEYAFVANSVLVAFV